MAKTWGYAIQGFASGLSTGFSMKMERAKIDALKKEQERLKKEKEEADKLFQDWYNSQDTKDFLMNLDTASQGERAYFTTGLIKISKEVFDYFTEIDNDIREGNIKEAQDKNDLVEAKLKSATDLAQLGMTAVFPDGSPMKISEEDIEFQKKIQIGKVAGGKTGEAIGGEIWKGRGYGELPAETKEPDLTGAVNYLKKFPNPTPEQFNSLKTGAEKYYNADLSNVTQESLWAPEKPAGVKTPTPPVPTTTENIREDILGADTSQDAKRIYKNSVEKYGKEYTDKAMGIPDGNIDKFWAEGQKPYLDKIKTSIGNILDEKQRLKKGTLTAAEVGVEFEGDQKVEEIYEMLRKEYKRYRDMLVKMGADVREYPELMTFEEYKKADIKPGMGLFYPSTWGKQKPSVYK